MHTARQSVLVPEYQLYCLPNKARAVACRGYAYILLVIDVDGNPVGWIDVECRGAKDAGDWMAQHYFVREHGDKCAS
jgi:hypothetical protein